MEQIVGERQDEQRSRRSIEAAFDIAVFDETSIQTAEFLCEEAFSGLCEGEGNIVFAVQEDKIQSVLQLIPCIAAMRRNPRLKGAKRLLNMADIERVETGLIRAVARRDKPYQCCCH